MEQLNFAPTLEPLFQAPSVTGFSLMARGRLAVVAELGGRAMSSVWFQINASPDAETAGTVLKTLNDLFELEKRKLQAPLTLQDRLSHV